MPKGPRLVASQEFFGHLGLTSTHIFNQPIEVDYLDRLNDKFKFGTQVTMSEADKIALLGELTSILNQGFLDDQNSLKYLINSQITCDRNAKDLKELAIMRLVDKFPESTGVARLDCNLKLENRRFAIATGDSRSRAEDPVDVKVFVKLLEHCKDLTLDELVYIMPGTTASEECRLEIKKFVEERHPEYWNQMFELTKTRLQEGQNALMQLLSAVE